MIEYCVNCCVNRASLCAECEQYDLDHIAALQAKLAQKQAMAVQLSRQVATLEAELATERARLENTRLALEDVLDSMGALANPSELSGWAIDDERAQEIIELARGAK